jgi:hypothetical protein
VGLFNGTAPTQRPSFLTCSFVSGTERLWWRLLLDPAPSAASSATRFLDRLFPKLGQCAAGRHEPGGQFVRQPAQRIHWLRPGDPLQFALRRRLEPRKSIQNLRRLSAPVLFSAAPNASTGSSTISAQGTSGSLSHPASLALTIQAGVAANLLRTTYSRTDSVPAMDDPSGEPHHRHIAYDPARQHVFVANRAMNRVEIFSSTSFTRLAQITIPGASSADLSIDGATVWIGTVTEQVVAIDTSSLQIKARYGITGLQPLPNALFDRPVELLALSGGS